MCFRRPSVLALSRASDVVDLKDHLDYLGSQQDLLLLADQGLNHMLLLHVCVSKTETPFSQSFHFDAEVQCRGSAGVLPLVLLCRQSIPRKGLDSLTCLALTSVMVWMGFSPLFSARAIGITSSASANDLMAYCSNVGH